MSTLSTLKRQVAKLEQRQKQAATRAPADLDRKLAWAIEQTKVQPTQSHDVVQHLHGAETPASVLVDSIRNGEFEAFFRRTNLPDTPLPPFVHYIKNPYDFATECCYTQDEVDMRNPVKLLPKKPHIRELVHAWETTKRLVVVKSRRMQVTWTGSVGQVVEIPLAFSETVHHR